MRIDTPQEFCALLVLRGVGVRGVGTRGLRIRHLERLEPDEIRYWERNKKALGKAWSAFVRRGVLPWYMKENER